MDAGELFIERLLRVAPELKGAYEEHLVDNDMLLPHVFMGDVTRFVVAAAEGGNDRVVVQRILDYFEIELKAGEAESLELIRASFVENLTGESTVVNKLKPMMGTGLRREIEAICGA
ncbi:MAG: hypothetical protein AABY83_00315 [Pseudomonadota bacterium]